MEFSTSASRKATLVAGAIVAVTAVLSITNEWGTVMALSFVAGVAAVVIELAPSLKLPAARGVTMFALGGVATLATSVAAIDWLGWIAGHLFRFDTLQFLTGFAAAIVLLVVGFGRYQAERRSPAASPASASSASSAA
jgi:hypothetical protein